MKITIELTDATARSLGHIADVLHDAAKEVDGKSASLFLALQQSAAGFDAAWATAHADEVRQRHASGELARKRYLHTGGQLFEVPEFPTYVGSDGQEHGEY